MMVPKSGLLFALFIASCSALAIDNRVLGENEVFVPGVGNIEGVTSMSSWTQRKIYEFRGVPYAEPPEGARRFSYPEKMHSWEPATFKAQDFAPACPQPSVPELPAAFASLVMKPDEWVLESQRRRAMSPDYDERIIGEENNCLTLDIYTPTLNSSAMLPVLVYIHGGAFITGSSAGHRPGNLLERDMVLVVPQYRLGPFGFMYLNDPNAPGNMGLADQALALKWVRNNIAAFGGDPSSITVGGVSAGAASVSLHMLNRNNTETGRLFDRVIATSGSALALWALETSNERAVEMSRDIALLSGCPQKQPDRLMECMREKNTSTIINAYLVHQALQMRSGNYGGGASIPVVQTGNEGVDMMVNQLPQCTMEKDSSAHVTLHCYDTPSSYLALPLLAGVCEHEGLLGFDMIYLGYLIPNRLLNDSLFLRDEYVATVLKDYGVEENSRVMADACTRRFFEREELGDFDTMTPGMIDFLGETYFKGPVFRQTELHSLKEKAYLYSFEYFGEHSMRINSPPFVQFPGGITHADDTLYIFPSELFPMNRTLDLQVAQRMVDIYANFITWGDPTPEGIEHPDIPMWLSYNRAEANYMHIEDKMVMKSSFRETFTTTHRDGLTPPVYADSQDNSNARALSAMPIVVLVASVLLHLRVIFF